MSLQLLPVDSSPNQSFQSKLSINDVNITLKFNIRFNEIANYWCMTVSDPATGIHYITDVPLLAGDYPAGNMLQQVAYLGIGSCFVFNVGGSQDDSPTKDNLGTDFIIVWGDM